MAGRTRALTISAWRPALLLLIVTEAGAKPHPLGAGFDGSAEIRLSGAYDDNALLGRRGQYLGAQGGSARRTDTAFLQSLRAGVGRRFGADHRLGLDARCELAQWRSVDELAGHDVGARLEWLSRIEDGAFVQPSFRAAYHSETQVEWRSRLLEPGLRAAYTTDTGVLFDAHWRYTVQQFGPFDRSETPRNSYQNIDARGHRAELGVRQWIGRQVRASLLHDFWTARYAGNLSANLADYAGLPAGTPRRDLGAGLTAELVAEPLRGLLPGVGARYESNLSNGNAFRYRAVHGLANLLYALTPSHSLYAELDAARYWFPDERFDRRYSNTRVDQRWNLAAAYRFGASEHLRFEVVFRRVDARSNDCPSFSPQRDATGLSLYSRSYSCFDRTRVEVSARWEL